MTAFSNAMQCFMPWSTEQQDEIRFGGTAPGRLADPHRYQITAIPAVINTSTPTA